jgi:hypothetical protein
VAVMRFPEATGVRRSSCGRQRRWGEASRQREEHEQSGSQAMHSSWVFEAYQLAVDERKNEVRSSCLTPEVEDSLSFAQGRLFDCFARDDTS